jgi:tetratricopeptide (TPR) repeat protein
VSVVLALALKLAPPVSATAPARSLPRLAVAALIPVAVGGWTFLDHAHSRFDESVHALANGDYARAMARAGEAADADPSSAAYHIHAGVSQAIAYLVETEQRDNVETALLDSAIGSLRRAIELEPRSAIAYANLAIALELRTDAPAAADAALDALRRAPGDAAIAAVAGTVLEWAGRAPEALDAYTLALDYDAALAQSPFWNTTPARAAMRSTALQRSALTACEKGRVAAFFPAAGEDLEAMANDCSLAVDRSPGDARRRSDLAVILHALGRDTEAKRAAEEAVARVPDNPFARTALAIVRGAGGDLAGLRHELLLATQLGDPDAPLLLAQTYGLPLAATAREALRLPASDEPPPKQLVERLEAALPRSASMVYDGGQHYLLGILYYRTRFLRESPVSLLIPGEWIALASPRALQLLDSLNALRAAP